MFEAEARIKAKKAQNARVKAEMAENKSALEVSRLAYRSSSGLQEANKTSERLQWKLLLNEKARDWASVFQEYINVEIDETRLKALEKIWVDPTIQGLQKANEVHSLTQKSHSKAGEEKRGDWDELGNEEDVEMGEE